MSHRPRTSGGPAYRELAAALLSVVCAAAACGGSGSDPSPDPADSADSNDLDGETGDTGADADADTDTDADAGDGENDGPPGDPGNDAETDSAPDGSEEPECTPPLRAVGQLCRKPFDRACIDDSNCRPDETCVWAPSDTLTGTCIFTPGPPFVCPGAPSCPPTEDAVFRAAFGAVDVTPRGWEFAREGFSESFDAFGNPRQFVGDVTDTRTFCDCGRDMICPPGDEFEGCRSVGTWTGPDADGTEGDGYMQGNWMAGFNEGRNANFCPDEWLAEDCDGPECCADPAFHDPLWVRGAVVEFGNTRVAVLTIDAVGYFYSDIERHLEALPAEWEIDHLLMSSTHGHQGSDTMGRWGPGFLGASLPTDSGRVPAWLDEVHDAVVELIGDCVTRLEPAELHVGQFRTPREEFALRDSRDPYVAADVATVMRVVRAGGEAGADDTLGVWLDWHNHAEAVGDDNRVVSSDFPHWVRLGLENGLDAASDEFGAVPAVGGVAVYLAGAVGGLMTPLGATVVSRVGEAIDEDGYAKAEALGERLAHAASLTMHTPCTADERFDCYRAVEPTLAFATVELLLDLENVNFQTGAIDLELFQRPVYNWRRSDGSGFNSRNLPKMLTAMTQLRLGPVTWQTFPGEPFPETFTGFDLEAAARFAQVGDSRDLECAADLRTRLEPGVEPRFGCLNDLDNPAPPDLDAAPTGPGLYDALPGDIVVPIGNGMDSVGYFIPSYDYVVHPEFGVLVAMPGDHYEEEVSVGDVMPRLLEVVFELTGALGNR